MFRKFYKIVTIALLIFALTIPAYASRRGIGDNAEDIVLDRKYAFFLDEAGEEEGKDFRLILSGNRGITLKYEARVPEVRLYLCDANGRRISPSNIDIDVGRRLSGSQVIGSLWNTRVYRSAGTVTYNRLERGTYYIRFYTDSYDDGYDEFDYGYTSLTVSRGPFIEDQTAEDTGSGSPEVSIRIPLQKGKTIKLGAFTRNTGPGVPEWKSSHTRIATVSNDGLVTGISPGTATITLSVDGKKHSIRVRVTE
ncbi:MAG: Ig-like domain-containing protein [Oscillospiraceae bacterium]|nr:Ig-like domain-containing protein [Oscillospiraceae bacterium]